MFASRDGYSYSDEELADYRQLLRELKALLPEDAPKMIERQD